MSIENISTEDLLAEIERRKKEEEENHQDLYIGIIDDNGLESMVLVKDSTEFASKIRALQLRARFNGHRRPIVFSVKMPKQLFEEYRLRLGGNTNDELAKRMGDSLKQLSTFNELGG
jgi:hypothetical protein